MNDVLVVALHLASQQWKVENHNRAMAVLLDSLTNAVQAGTFSANEKDILIGGDLNASLYDSKEENFWRDFDPAGFRFRVLASEDPTTYHPTRLGGVPLRPLSQIDYFLGAFADGGIGEELVQGEAHVHGDLLAGFGFDGFREHLSDHVPVTVRLRVMADGDPSP